jgi:alanine racemase
MRKTNEIQIDSVGRTWVKINTKALQANFQNLSKNVDKNSNKEVLKMAVVKSNAYGHGMIECAQILEKEGVDFLAVDCIEEALTLCENKIKSPILVLGFTPKENFQSALDNNISITISSIDSLKNLLAFSKSLSKNTGRIKIHIKADTGLHRQGFLKSERDTVLKLLKTPAAKNICVEGLYSHLAGAESQKFNKYTLIQNSDFTEWVEEFWATGFDPITHIGASAASILYPETYFDMVRFGISLYGLWPDSKIEQKSEIVKNLNKNKLKNHLPLKPVLTWESIVTDIKKVKKGEPVGYDCAEKLKKDSVIAVVPIGYWHGLPRHASLVGEILINGKFAKILGKVSMDMIIVDVTNIKVRHGDIATIIGKNGKQFASAENLAEKCKTINYEIVTRINPKIPRIFE